MRQAVSFVLEYLNILRYGSRRKKFYLQDGTMLRSFLISLSRAAWAQKLITNWSFAWRAASRFVAGERTEDVIRVIRELNKKGFNATLNYLGESISTAEEAEKATDEILKVLNEIDKADVKSNVSIKLTQIGMGLDENICQQGLVQILDQVKKCRNFLRVDMEDTPYTDITISLYHAMLERGFDQSQIGLVLQAYLFRAEDDLRKLLEIGTRIRLVKGAYNEPPDKAYPRKVDTDANFDLLTKITIDAALKMDGNEISADGKIPPVLAIASHDEKRIGFAKQYAEKVGLSKNAIEFQMLYGIRRDLQEKLLKEGYPVRVYVPYGSEWYPYFMRRLAERPENIWFFISNYFRK